MTMRTPVKLLTGLGVLALHALAFWMASHAALSVQSRLFQKTSPVVLVAIVPTLPEPALPKPLPPPPAQIPLTSVAPDKPLATLAAPPPPTAEEWAFAAQYTQKNSKGYRYSWGQQVRSMMGTAVEGPQQGVVRFRVVIAPSGQLAQLDTLWSTSAAAEQLARKAIQALPPLPPTPTGQPLIFEKTISFTPFADDGPPIYKDDCLPDPPVFRNPFVWDGKSPQTVATPAAAQKLTPEELDACLRQLPKDSIEAEAAQDKREMQRWGWR